MNLADTVGFEGLENVEVSEELRPLVKEMVRRFEAFRVNLFNQLNSQSTVFYANPDTEPDKVSGAKPGDIAVYVEAGTSKFHVFTEEDT